MSKKKSPKVLGKGAVHVPPTGSLWREVPRLQSQWFIHSFRSVGVPKKGALLRYAGKTCVHRPRTPTRAECLQTRVAAWFPWGVVAVTEAGEFSVSGW
jgi:hypothetical protein